MLACHRRKITSNTVRLTGYSYIQGCKFDVLLGRCDSATNMAGGATTTTVSYCASNDSVCASCPVSSSRPVCMGEDWRCICQTLCSVMATVRSSCKKEDVPIATVWLGFGGFAFVLPFLLFIQRKCNEPRGIQHMMYNRRRRRQRKHRDRERDTTRDLTLAEWRDHRELHKLEMGEIELKTCYLLIQDAKVPPASGQVESSQASSSGDESGDAAGGPEQQSTKHEEMEVASERVFEHFDDQEEFKLDDDDEGSDASDSEQQLRVSVTVDDRRWLIE